MTSLAFVIGMIALFAAVLTWESSPEERSAVALRPAGLWRWLVGGNWPAKVGALLLIIGTGALLRYLMLRIDVPPDAKLLGGVGIAAILGVSSSLLRNCPERRAVHLALGGAALGVAYLTAYSAYAFFHVIGEHESLALLFLVAAGATAFAVTSRALSLAVLAMFGAYIAPAFALETPGPVMVYGYYILASLLTLLMVVLRGWRPLIHLSLLFTLAGALFFGWTRQYYSPEFYAQMQPLLYLLVAVHLAMPLLESGRTNSIENDTWRQRFDLGYFFLLPLVASVLTLLIAPAAESDGAWGMLGLGLLWLVAAGIEYRLRRDAMRYAGIAAILFSVAGLLALGSHSWFMIMAIAACGLLALGPRFGVPAQVNGLLVAVALSTAACFLLQSLLHPAAARPFLNPNFVRHLLLAAAFGAAGLGMRKRGERMASVFLAVGGVWLLTLGTGEFVRYYMDNLSQALHILLLATTLGYAVFLRNHAPRLAFVILLAGGLFYTGLFCAASFTDNLIVILLLVGQVAFSLLAYHAGRHGEEGETVAGVARSALPFLLFPWAAQLARLIDPTHTTSIVMTLLVVGALLASIQAQLALPHDRRWPNQFSPVGFIVFGLYLLFQSLFYIRREPWDVAYELIALTYLAITLRFLLAADNRDAKFFSLITVFATISVSIAMLLRLFGPDEAQMTIFSLKDMLLPTMVSFLWALIGALLTWWATRSQSRGLWSTGAIFLIASAVKLILFDFGSLGELGNIVAMMAAGGVFMLVAWLAPFPPKPEQEYAGKVIAAPTTPESAFTQADNQLASYPQSSKDLGEDNSGRIWLWILIGMLIIGAAILTGALSVILGATWVPELTPLTFVASGLG